MPNILGELKKLLELIKIFLKKFNEIKLKKELLTKNNFLSKSLKFIFKKYKIKNLENLKLFKKK